MTETTDVGTTITRIWGEVLAVDVSETSDFFECGGHSVPVVQVLTRVHDTYGLELSVRDLFDNPMLGDFITVVRARIDGKAGTCA